MGATDAGVLWSKHYARLCYWDVTTLFRVQRALPGTP